jgi:hypothetical protein
MEVCHICNSLLIRVMWTSYDTLNKFMQMCNEFRDLDDAIEHLISCIFI